MNLKIEMPSKEDNLKNEDFLKNKDINNEADLYK